MSSLLDSLDKAKLSISSRFHLNVKKNRLEEADLPIHAWYNFVVGYPPHLVREYLNKFKAVAGKSVIFDPFCGTGTTLVEAKKLGFESYGIDGNPMAVLASKVKTNWKIDLPSVVNTAKRVARYAQNVLEMVDYNKIGSIEELERKNLSYSINGIKLEMHGEQLKKIPYGFISKIPLIKFLILKEAVLKTKEPLVRDFLLLALGSILPGGVGNVRFGPEIGKDKPKDDAQVIELFEAMVEIMVEDLKKVDRKLFGVKTHVALDDARILRSIPNNSIDIVITSPPYPNEKEYTRNSRLELVLLDFVKDREALREVKRSLLSSNTRTVSKVDDDDSYVEKFGDLQKLARKIEKKRIELKKDSGFERLYHRVLRLYFGGMYKHLKNLYPKMKKKGKCAYVVGDQMSYFLIPVRTAHFLTEIAEDIGYKVIGCDLWRHRRSTNHSIDLEENVLLLEKI